MSWTGSTLNQDEGDSLSSTPNVGERDSHNPRRRFASRLEFSAPPQSKSYLDTATVARG